MNNTTVKPLLWDPSTQGIQNLVPEKINVHIIFVFVTSNEGTPLFRGKGHFFWVPKPQCNLPSGDTLVNKN